MYKIIMKINEVYEANEIYSIVKDSKSIEYIKSRIINYNKSKY